MPDRQVSRDLQREVTRAFLDVQGDVSLRAIQDVLAGEANIGTLLRALDRTLASHTQPIADILDAAVARGIAQGYTSGGVASGLNLVDPRRVTFGIDRAGAAVQGLMDEQASVLRRLLRAGIPDGYTPTDRAKLIKASIGLNDRYARAVEKYREGLRIAKMPAAQANKLMQAYADRLRASRARMVAETETNISVNAGQEILWRTAKRRGFLAGVQLRVWDISEDERTCPVCMTLDGVAVGLDEPWITENGDAIWTPGTAHPHCRCSEHLDLSGRRE